MIRKDDKIYYCENCGNERSYSSKSGLCFDCINKKRRENSTRHCRICGNKLNYSNQSGLCRSCYDNYKYCINDNPTKEELSSLLNKMTFTDIGRKYGVSANTVKNWCKKFKLPYLIKDLKRDNWCGMKKKDNEYFLNKLKKLNREDLLPIEDYKGWDTPIYFECQLCGHIFKMNPKNIRENTGMCPECHPRSKSNGERQIKRYFEELDILFLEQYKFDDLYMKQEKTKLRFDFAVFDFNNELIFLLEYNGRQHYEPIKYFGGKKSFESAKKSDGLKSDYCKDNNIKLYTIKYNQIKELKDILFNILLENKLISSQPITTS